MSNINIKIIMPDQVKLDDSIESVTMPGIDGDFEVLPGHSPFITKLRSCVLNIKKHDQHEFIAIHEGFVTVDKNQILILSDDCERKEEIDIKRAEAAKERAEKRMAEKSDDIDFRKAEAALKRAIARIQTVNS